MLFDAKELAFALHRARRTLLCARYGDNSAKEYDRIMGVTDSVAMTGPAMMASLNDAVALMALVIQHHSQNPWELCQEEAITITADADDLIDVESVALLPGAVTALSALKGSGFIVGVITGDHRRRTEKQLEHGGLKPYIDILITADDVHRPKPDPESLVRALQQAGIMPEQALMIGDTTNDWLMAKSMGVPAIAVGNDYPATDIVNAQIPDLRSLVVVR